MPGVVALVRAGDPEAVALVRYAGRRIGEVLAVAVNLLNPQVVVFGGDLAEAFEPLLASVREQVYRRAIVPVTRDLAIEQSALGPGAGSSVARRWRWPRCCHRGRSTPRWLRPEPLVTGERQPLPGALALASPPRSSIGGLFSVRPIDESQARRWSPF